jgi:5-formyltetrahydrofolate cyclo-ligase
MLATTQAVLWPRLRASGELELAPSSASELVRDAAGLLTPPLDRAAVAVGPADVVIVPGVGFTRAGARLGRGGGHYDRLLSHCAATSIGVAFDIQLVDELPTEPHDRPVDLVVTPGGVWRRAQ